LKPEFSSIATYISSWITLEQGKTTADAMGDVWRGLEVVEAAARVGSDMMVRRLQTWKGAATNSGR